MNKVGIQRVKYSDEETFTTDLGIEIRKKIYKPLQKILKLATDGKIVLESIHYTKEKIFVKEEHDLSYLNLEKNTPYIFASSHSFCEDLNAALSNLDRNAYVLVGTTDQIDHNKEVYCVWFNGMVYVCRTNEKSRNQSIAKMGKVLQKNSSILMYPEGGYNNSENLLIGKLFNGPYKLNKEFNAKVIPVASFREYGSDTMYVTFDRPLDFSNMSKEEYQETLRDNLASMMYELWYHHASRIKRCDLKENAREQFMEERKSEYMKKKWSHDVWDEEIPQYYDPYHPTPEQVREFVDKVTVTPQNAAVLGPVLVKRKEDLKYNFKKYMKDTWNKE